MKPSPVIYEISFLDSSGQEIPRLTGFRPLDSTQSRELQFMAMAEELGAGTEYKTRLLRPREARAIGEVATSGVIDRQSKQHAIYEEVREVSEVFREFRELQVSGP